VVLVCGCKTTKKDSHTNAASKKLPLSPSKWLKDKTSKDLSTYNTDASCALLLLIAELKTIHPGNSY